MKDIWAERAAQKGVHNSGNSAEHSRVDCPHSSSGQSLKCVVLMCYVMYRGVSLMSQNKYLVMGRSCDIRFAITCRSALTYGNAVMLGQLLISAKMRTCRFFDMDNVSIVSFNLRGIRNKQKRRTVFRHLHVKYPNHVVCIQETHSSAEVEQQWRNEWGAVVLFNHQSALRGGVAILLPRKFKGSVLRQDDKEGRIITIEFKLKEEIFSVIGIY